MNYLVGIDLGTSGTKTVLFDENSKSIASAAAEYSLSHMSRITSLIAELSEM